MSTAEPVSAFGAFKAARDKQKPAKATASKGKKPGAKAAAAGNGKPGKPNKAAQSASKTNGNAKAKGKQLNGSPTASNGNAKVCMRRDSKPKKKAPPVKKSKFVNMVEDLMGDPDKKLTAAQKKKKQELEKYLVDQLEKDTYSGDSFSDFDSEEEDETGGEGFSDSMAFTDEYTLNSGSFTDTQTDASNLSYSQEESASPSPVSKSNRKRSVGEMANNKSNNKNNSNAAAKPKVDPKKAKVTQADKGERKASITTVSVKLEPLAPPNNSARVNSIEEGKRAFKWLLNPVKLDVFFAKYWESKACLIKRQQGDYFSHLISFEGIDQMLLKNHVEFTKNLDITSYKNGIRETLNPEGRALPPVVWSHYGQGCSIRLLNPQTFMPNLYTLCATLQELFHCLVGANAYLTPPNSQGFAPHYDDIEAFVMQIEGRKRWKLYKPRNQSEVLPRYSSQNFTQKEIGQPILDEVLEPGDVLYFPRGTIHQASTEPGYHSLHITLSVYQKQSYADLFEKMFPIILQKAIASNLDLRRGLPLHTFQNAGLAHSESTTKERAELQKTITQLMFRSMKEVCLNDVIDAAVDQVAKKFQHEALPPEILPSEKARTVFGSTSTTNKSGECVCDYDIDQRTNVRLLRANILRLVEEEGQLRIYFYVDNSKEYCEYEPNFMEIDASVAASVEILIRSYPAYVGVSQLPLPSDEQKIDLVSALWERGLLMMEKPFK